MTKFQVEIKNESLMKLRVTHQLGQERQIYYRPVG